MDYMRVNIPGLKQNVYCYQPLWGRQAWGGYRPVCCYRRNFWQGTKVFHYGVSSTTLADDGAAMNVVTRGFLTDSSDFQKQRQAYLACCGEQRFATVQCREFLRRRPFTRNWAIRTPGGYRGDVQVQSFDGINIVYNGAMEMLMAKGNSIEPGVGFVMTALLQPGFTATQVTFTTAVAVQCRSGKRGTSDLVQLELTADRTKMQLRINRVLRTDLTTTKVGDVRLKNATIRISDTNITVVLHCGLTVQGAVVQKSLSLQTLLIPDYKGRVTGLLGNNDGNPANDLRSRDGSKVLPANTSEQQLFPVASTWRVNCSDSNEALLHTGRACGAFNDLTFTPAFFDMNRARQKHPEGEKLCGSNIACWVDLLGTGDQTLAEQAKKEDEQLAEKRSQEANKPPEFKTSVIICNLTAGVPGYCSIVASDPDPKDSVTMSLNGTRAWMQFDASTQKLSWSAPPKDLGKEGLTITAIASDSRGGVTSQPVIIHLCACQNGGTCETPATPLANETYASFLDLPCRCPKSWAGSHCDQDADGCLGNPCVTHCTDVSAAEEIADPSAPAFRCAPCAPGYQGNGQMCSDINECLNRKVALSQICINRPGSFEIGCVKGFIKEKEECRDIDECVTGTAVCPRFAICRNLPGNYSCECPSGTYLMGSSCVDQEECSDGTPRCSSDPNTECSETFGGFECVCKSGFRKSASGNCVASDLCELKSVCSQICTAKDGGFQCSCETGFQLAADRLSCLPSKNCSEAQLANCQGGQCSIDNSQKSICVCNPGQDRQSSGSLVRCQDKNECEDSSLNSCRPSGVAICKDKTKGYECACPKGYQLSTDGTTCTDIDECSSSFQSCDPRTSKCKNSQGSYDCICNDGFEKASNGSCVDRNECSSISKPCSDSNAVCRNLVGSYACLCKAHYKSNGTQCVDINECEYPNPNECDSSNGICFNTEGGHKCGCKPGFRKSPTSNACLDIDECNSGLSNCSGICRNTLGSYVCICPNPDGCSKTPTTAATTTPNTAPSTAPCTSWSAWGSCEGSCGGSGLQDRSRTCRDQKGVSVEERSCEMPACRSVTDFGVSQLQLDLLFSKEFSLAVITEVIIPAVSNAIAKAVTEQCNLESFFATCCGYNPPNVLRQLSTKLEYLRPSDITTLKKEINDAKLMLLVELRVRSDNALCASFVRDGRSRRRKRSAEQESIITRVLQSIQKSGKMDFFNKIISNVQASLRAAGHNVTLSVTIKVSPRSTTSDKPSIPVWGYAIIAVAIVAVVVFTVLAIVLVKRRRKDGVGNPTQESLRGGNEMETVLTKNGNPYSNDDVTMTFDGQIDAIGDQKGHDNAVYSNIEDDPVYSEVENAPREPPLLLELSPMSSTSLPPAPQLNLPALPETNFPTDASDEDNGQSYTVA